MSWSEQEEKVTAHSWSRGERADLGDQQSKSSLTVTEGRQPGRRGARMLGPLRVSVFSGQQEARSSAQSMQEEEELDI